MSSVTVVIPFWDLDLNILKDCVRSVRAQTESCEILVIDNHSNPPVPELAGTRVVRLPERVSVGRARTLGLQYVETDYLMFMDADDKLLPGAISHLRKLLDKTPGASLAAGRIVDWIPETGAQNPKPWPSAFAHKANSRSSRLFRACNVMRNMTPVTGCAVMNTEMAKNTAGFPDSTAEDWTFGALMSFQGRVILSERDVKLYRWREDGLSKQAVRNIKALYDARRTTRRAVANDPLAPQWMKKLSPVIAVVHLMEMPFHIYRERAFANVAKITAPKARVVPNQPPVIVLESVKRRPIPTASRLGIPTQTIATTANAIAYPTVTVGDKG